MREIEGNDELEVGKYYHCFAYGTGLHSIHKCYDDAGGKIKYISRNHIWADNKNNQALEKWRIFEVDVPNVGTIYLCDKHHGYGFASDCAICQESNK